MNESHFCSASISKIRQRRTKLEAVGLKTNHHKQERSTNGHLRPSTSGVVHLNGPDWEVINLGLIVAKLIPCVPCALYRCGESQERWELLVYCLPQKAASLPVYGAGKRR